MELEVGDIIAGRGIQTGRYQGIEVVNSKEYFKIFDMTKKAIFFIPTDRTDDIRKLPSKETVKRNLKIFKDHKVIDDGLVDGSRYKYFKEKIAMVNFKKSIEVLHDLCVLKADKEISSSERKLLNELKEKLLGELTFILDCDISELESMIEINKQTA